MTLTVEQAKDLATALNDFAKRAPELKAAAEASTRAAEASTHAAKAWADVCSRLEKIANLQHAAGSGSE